MATVQDIYNSDQNTYELPLYYRKDVWLVSPRIRLHRQPNSGWSRVGRRQLERQLVPRISFR